MQFFAATLLLVALTQSNAQVGGLGCSPGRAPSNVIGRLSKTLGEGITYLGEVFGQLFSIFDAVISGDADDASSNLKGLRESLSGLKNSEKLINNLARAAESGNPIAFVGTILDIAVNSTLVFLSKLVDELGSVLQSSDDILIHFVGGVLVALGKLLGQGLVADLLGSLGETLDEFLGLVGALPTRITS